MNQRPLEILADLLDALGLAEQTEVRLSRPGRDITVTAHIRVQVRGDQEEGDKRVYEVAVTTFTAPPQTGGHIDPEPD